MRHRIAASLRILLPAAVFAAGVAAMTSPAEALISYPYCLKVYVPGGPYSDCSYSTLAQCQLSASGRSALCYRDPFYKGAPGSAYVVTEPRVPYSPFGSNIDPNYDPYRTVAQPQAVAPKHSRHHRRKRD